MSETDLLLQILDGGTDAVMIPVAYLLWRIDRRLIKLEIEVEKGLSDAIYPKKAA